MRRIIPFFLGLVMSVTMMAQSTGKQTLQARMLTTRQPSSKVKTFGANGNTVEVVLKLDDATAETTIEQLKAAGLTLHSRLGQQVSATMPQSAIHAVEQLPGVVRIATHTPLPKMMSDVTRDDIHSSDVDGEQGFVGQQPYTGQGVTIIVLDSGFDFQHPAFYDEQGNCRIKGVYMPYDEDGVGVEIDGMTLPGSFFDSPEQIAQLTTDNAYLYHGSHTATIAAGTRSPQGFGGVAPDADIVLCCTYPNKGEDEPMSLSELVSTPGLFHSLAFAGHYAKQQQQRVVVSASLGTNNGSHNGKGVITEAFEALCQQGVPVVLSCGNEGDHRLTLHKIFESDDDVLRGMMGSNTSLLEGYTYADVPLSMQVSLVQQETDEDDEYVYTTVWQSPVLDADGGSLLNVNSNDDEILAEGFDGEMSIGVQKGEDGTYLACYYQGEFTSFNYLFEVTIRSQQGTELYLYGNHLESREREGYSDSSESFMTMSDWTTAPDVISVGAYCANDIKRTLWKEPQQDENNTLGDIAAFSSFGVGINGVQCPTLSAPGVNVVSAISHYYIDLMNQMGGDFDDDDDDFNDEDDDFNDNDDLFYLSSSTPQFREEMMWNGFHYTGEEGTSQAAPAVAGTVALWLQADPSLTVAEIKDIIAQSCRTDEFTEASPERFGYGKVDAKRGMELVLERMSTGIQQLPDDTAISNHNIFMLDGRQVYSTPTRGIYIVNGKKVIVQ